MPKSRHSPFLIGLKAARINFAPGLIVQTLMFAIVAGYYWYPPMHAALEQLAAIKDAQGYLFSIVVTIAGGAILPEILNVLVFQKGKVRRANFANLRFTLVYWGLDGMLVDFWYRLQGDMFGNVATWDVVARKVAMDQFVITPLVFVPLSLTCYEWKNCGYSFAGTAKALTWKFYKERGIQTLVTNWAMWIPLLFAVYALPAPLQIPMFALALSFWVMLFTYISVAGHAASIKSQFAHPESSTLQ